MAIGLLTSISRHIIPNREYPPVMPVDPGSVIQIQGRFFLIQEVTTQISVDFGGAPRCSMYLVEVDRPANWETAPRAVLPPSDISEMPPLRGIQEDDNG